MTQTNDFLTEALKGLSIIEATMETPFTHKGGYLLLPHVLSWEYDMLRYAFYGILHQNTPKTTDELTDSDLNTPDIEKAMTKVQGTYS